MAQGAEQTFQIVMREVAEERRADAAMFLSGCFSLPLASTKNIAASAPIALLGRLERPQAEAIVAELRPSLPADVVLDIFPSGGPDAPDVACLQWPRPPRVYGKDIDEFAVAEEQHEIKCPHCGGLIRILHDGAGVKAVPPPAPERPRSSETAFGFAPARPDASPPVPPSPSSNEDPLFSGVKPLAGANADYASLRSLQAGDTGFWMDNKGLFAPGMPQREPLPAASVPGETSHSRRVRASAGLAAFMKPGVFSVVAGRSRDPQVVKMVAEIMGIPESEARDKCLSLSLAVARDISLDEAQSLLARLGNLGARARIVKPT